MRNFGEHEGEPCLLLGYRANNGNMLLVHLNDISGTAEVDTMINFLQRHRMDNRNIAAILAAEPSPFMGYPSMIAYYSGKAGHDGSSSSLRQIPEFYISMYDQQQSESWIGSSARYKAKQKSHPFLDRFKASLGQPITKSDEPLIENRPTIAPAQSEKIEGDAALAYLKQHNLPIPDQLKPMVEPVAEPMELEEFVSGGGSGRGTKVETLDTVAEQQLAALMQIVTLQKNLLEQQAEASGQIKRVLGRVDAVDKSLRSAARNMEKAGFEKPVVPPTKASRGKSS